MIFWFRARGIPQNSTILGFCLANIAILYVLLDGRKIIPFWTLIKCYLFTVKKPSFSLIQFRCKIQPCICITDTSAAIKDFCSRVEIFSNEDFNRVKRGIAYLKRKVAKEANGHRTPMGADI